MFDKIYVKNLNKNEVLFFPVIKFVTLYLPGKYMCMFINNLLRSKIAFIVLCIFLKIIKTTRNII